MIKVLIVDDHTVVRRGLRQIIEETPDMLVAGEAADASDAIEKILTEEFDVVLLDITMPGRNGLDVLAQMRRTHQKLPVLVLSMHPEEQYGIRVLKAGASGYLTKESAPDELVEGIRKVANGGKYISQSLAEKVVIDLEVREGKPAHALLSDREFQVLCKLAKGSSVKLIAAELNLSEKTISTYRSRLMEKLNLNTTSELIHYALANNLVE